MTYTLRDLSRAEAKQVYEEQMVRDFPPDELKSWRAIEKMLDEGMYRTCGLFAGEELCAYAYLLQAPGVPLMLLDYLAVCADRRGQGHGSAMMQQLAALPQPLLLEVEDTAYAADAAELQTRERRIHFYRKNGIRMSAVRACLFGCRFAIMYSGEPQADQTIYDALTATYACIRSHVPPQLQKDENFIITL